MKNQIAYCGLACCVCSETKTCPGCQAGGCDIHGWCKNYNCCREKSFSGCWECEEFPCSGGMLEKIRIRAFARFVKAYGEDELVRCLLRNNENGIVYHYDGQIIGDYDKGKTENEIIALVKNGVDKNADDLISHYDSLIDENNDPVHDPKAAQEYMDKWDGEEFIEALQLSPDMSVLEIGVGTGRLAVRICEECGSFTGVDISPKTIERAKENLRSFGKVELLCGDFLTFPFTRTFDVIYSSLTFLHIKDKWAAIQKASDFLKFGGRFVLSISKNQQTEFDFGSRRVPVFPDNPEETSGLLIKAGMTVENQFETEFAYVFTARKI